MKIQTSWLGAARMARRAQPREVGGGATWFLAAAPPDARMQWWREAKFGMFIHWGAYAQMAGVWDGKRMDPNGLIGGKKKAAPQE
jgi:hypothetical protein